MAEISVILNAVSSGLVDSFLPDRNIRPSQFPGVGASYDLTLSEDQHKRLYFKFNSFPENYKHNRLYSLSFVFPFIANGTSRRIWLYAPTRDFDPLTITYNTRTVGEYLPYERTSQITGNVQSAVLPYYALDHDTDAYKSLVAQKILKYSGAYVSVAYSSYTQDSFNALDENYRNPPRLTVWYDDTEIVTSTVVGTGKTSGYLNPHIAQEMAWDFVPDGDYYCAADWAQASAVFHWRSGTSGAWTNVTASGANKSVTIPANIFPVGTIQWYVSGTDDYGTATDSPVYTLNTEDSSMTATPISPISTVEDGSAAIIFSWSVANDNGNAPTGADLQYSSDGSTWTAMASVTGAATTYSAPANSLPGGVLYWRVRAYNADSVAGAWSEAVSFISVSAPAAPIVSVNAVPFAVISWQSVGQQAYKVTVDGVSYGPFFGTVKEYAPSDYLEDGEHTASVEIQGAYGLWSQAGAVTFTIANVPGDGVTLIGAFDRDGVLSWETESTTADFLVYRDGKQIGATVETAFTDRVVLGSHSYQVINRLANGNYTPSNIVNGVMRSCTTAISPLNGGEWLELKLSENSYSEQRFSWGRTTIPRHVAGAVYPVIEMSEFEDASGSYDVSFPDVDSANAFLALRGQMVILKSRGGKVIIGALTQVEQAYQDFYITFAFTIQRIDWEDFVNDQNR